MRARIERIAANQGARDSFRNGLRLQRLLAESEPVDERSRLRRLIEIANERLRAGESGAAIEDFERAIAAAAEAPELHPAGLERRLREVLAVAHLRLGEQENCLLDHGAEACILPVRGSGVHDRIAGARGAAKVLDALLEQRPEDLRNVWLRNIVAMTLGEWPEGVDPRWRIDAEVFEDGDAWEGEFRDVAATVGADVLGAAGGVITEDFDGDGLFDLLVSAWGVLDPLVFLRGVASEGRLEWVDATEEAGIAGLPGGLNLVQADVDNDGDQDVLVLRGAWLRDLGRLPNSLLLNDGAGRFEDVTEAAGLLTFHPTQVGAWADVDRDGRLDLFVGNESIPGEVHRSELFLQSGAGSDSESGDALNFEERAAELGLDVDAIVKGAAWGDIDNDGWPDLFVSTLRAPNLLFHNRAHPSGTGRQFVEVAAQAGVGEPQHAFATWWFDVDNDGWLDLFVGGYSGQFQEASGQPVIADYLGVPTRGARNHLFLNQRDGTFADVSEAFGVAVAALPMGANFGDLDNDGWLDFYLGTGAPDFAALVPNRAFRNMEGRSFAEVTSGTRLGHLQKGHGIAFTDLDFDGDQDLVAVMGGAFSGDIYPNAVFRNPLNQSSENPFDDRIGVLPDAVSSQPAVEGVDDSVPAWVTLQLKGNASSRDAQGARVALRVRDRTSRLRELHRTVGSGGSFGASSILLEVGLGAAESIEEVSVRWPVSGEQRWLHVPMRRRVVLEEGRDEVSVREIMPLRLGPP